MAFALIFGSSPPAIGGQTFVMKRTLEQIRELRWRDAQILGFRDMEFHYNDVFGRCQALLNERCNNPATRLIEAGPEKNPHIMHTQRVALCSHCIRLLLRSTKSATKGK